MKWPWATCLIGLAACASDDGIERCPLGDSDASVGLDVIRLGLAGQKIDIQPGADIELALAPQGGWLILVGARATNLDGCHTTLSTSFKDIESDAIIKVDQRPTVLEDQGNGWGVSTPSTFGALPICPQVNSTRNLYDELYDMTVTVRDLDGKSASRTLRIRPTCPADSVQCRCECDRDYVLGGVCPA